MTCVLCGHEMVEDFTVFTVLRDRAVYVTEKVPCLRCPVCEHVAFTQEVAKRLAQYSSGRVLPASTYKAWVFKWGQPVTMIPRIITDEVRHTMTEYPGTLAIPAIKV